MRMMAMFTCMIALTTWGLIGVTSGSYVLPEDDREYDKQAQAADGRQEETMTATATVNLMVRDMAETLAFYRDVLGFEVVMTQPETAPYDWAMVTRGGANLMFQTVESLKEEDYFVMNSPQIGGTFTIFIVVPDVKQLHERVVGKATFVKQFARTFYGFDEFSIRDNNGYILTFATQVSE